MKILVACVASRAPQWIEAGWAHYSNRLQGRVSLQLKVTKPVSRKLGKTRQAMLRLEADRLRSLLPDGGYLVALDEKGLAWTTDTFVSRLQGWQSSGRQVTFVIGGPDGLDESLKHDANEQMRLSSLTLPHGLVRVLLAEALYRASSIMSNHPYHRE